nr:DUF2169 domain-containing protein [Sulfurimonas sp.]
IDLLHATQRDDLLPNIQDPKQLTTDKDEHIKPAGFMPLDINSKENMKKLGTFDEQWKREQWPGFARDMDYSFFNTAPKDQQIDGFFKGGESIELTNMNKEKTQILSHIPQASFRCFVTKTHKDKEDEFKELELHRDTLWLFPEIQRGIVIFRTTLKISDEIYSDIKYLNIKPIFEDEESKTLEQYYELQKKELDRSVEFDETPFEEMDAKIAEANKEVFDIPRTLKESIERSQGKKPSLRQTSAQKAEQTNTKIASALQRIDKAKVKLQGMKKEFGHLVKIDTSSLDRAKIELLSSKEKLLDAISKADELKKDADNIKLEDLAKVEELKLNPKIPDDLKSDMEMDFLKPKVKVWNDYAFDFLSECVKTVPKEPKVLHDLRHLGLAKRTLSRSWIGYNKEEKTIKPKEWLLDSDEDIVLPKGLVFSRFEESSLKYLKIQDKLILGSQEIELFLSEGNENFPLFYFKDDDMQAHLCDQEVFDICNTLCCDDISTIGDSAKDALEKASVVFYLQEDGVIEKLPNAKKFDCLEYESLFELDQNSIDIRQEMIKNLPQGISDTLPIKRDISAKAIREKSSKFTDKLKADLKAEAQKSKKEMQDDIDADLLKVNEILAKKGLEPISMTDDIPSQGVSLIDKTRADFDKAIAALEKQNAKPNIDIKDKIIELKEAKKEMLELVTKSEIMYKEGMEKLAVAKEKAQDPIPKWAKEMMIKAGIDPKNPHADSLTREDVIKLHDDGKSLAGKNLSNLDLSGLDLSSIDLSQANLKETNLKATNLSGANLKQTICTKTDFSDAKLVGVDANMTLFKESILDGTILDEMLANMAIFDKVIFKDVRCKDAKLDGVSFKECNLLNTMFEECELPNTIFLKTSITKTSFCGSMMDKVLFNESSIDECEFTSLDAKAMLFSKTKVTSSDFSHSQLYNLRILLESSFSDCKFIGSNMEKSTINKAILDGCDFQKSQFSNSLIKKSQLSKCDFRAVEAKKSRFEYASFEQSTFAGINLISGSLRRMELKMCDFSYANLYSAEVYKMKVFEVNFKGANLKRSNLEGRVDLIGKDDD